MLNFEELSESMAHVNATLGIADLFTPRDVQRFLRRFDANGDRQLSRAEHVRLYRSLLHAKLHGDEPWATNREMFIGHRQGMPADHYDIQGVLGEGTFGVVQRVQCRATGALRVMKVVDKQRAVSSGSPLTFVMEEVDKLKLLDHPSVLRLFEHFVDADALYLVTDFLTCGDLLGAFDEAHDTGRPLPDPWVRDVFRQVSEGVAYIHAKGIMHKDLKLDNVMLCSANPPEAVIIDVGLAELFPLAQAESFRSARAAGTIATMAPEVLMGSFSCKCDVWSMGCCLFALLVRRPQFLADPNSKEQGGYRRFPYPFLPTFLGSRPTRPELTALVERQRQGTELALLDGAGGAEGQDLLRALLTFGARSRPAMREVLGHPWLRRGGSDASGGDAPGASGGGPTSPVLGERQLESLLRFRHAGILEQAVLLDVASNIPLAKLRELKPLFEAMDQDGDGMLDVRELAEGMQRAGLSRAFAEAAAERLVNEKGCAKVEFSRFVAALVHSCPDSLLGPHLRQAFDRLDIDGDGFVSTEELRQFLESGPCGAAAQVAASTAASTSGRRFSLPSGAMHGGIGGGGGSMASDASPAARKAREALEELGGCRGKGRISFASLARVVADL